MLESNRRLREAVAVRRAAVAAGKPAEEWYNAMGFHPAEASTDGDDIPAAPAPVPPPVPPAAEPRYLSPSTEEPRYLPGTMAFLDVLEELKRLHLSKTHDYGDESAGDALANIRNGADMVGIAHWKGALVRAADKMQRLRTYCRVGRLVHEGVEDTLLDLAAYASLALVLFREECRDSESL